MRAYRSIGSADLGSCRPRQEVRKQLLPLLGEHRLGMELDALRRQVPVADGHDHVVCESAALELRRERLIDDQRVVAADLERPPEAPEDRLAIVLYLRRLAVDRL